LVPTSAGEIHVEPGAIPDLRYHILALEDGKMKGGMEKFVRDMCHSRPVHQQDRAALVVELPSAIEDNALNIRDVSVSPMIFVSEATKTDSRLTLRQRR
jgi:hypothetical protein